MVYNITNPPLFNTLWFWGFGLGDFIDLLDVWLGLNLGLILKKRKMKINALVSLFGFWGHWIWNDARQ